ncbi:MAG: glycosyltransferase family 2 protein [Deltaproteobacteria bacterium]|nr:glycosyltransferase family 2 protein [Deltaproteobacteria bacterium]
MSNLRITGIIIGIIGLLVTFIVYRGPKWNRLNFVLLTLFNFCLVIVCFNPDVVNFIQNALSLKELKRGRIFALLIISNIFLLFFSFYTSSKHEKLRLQFDGLVRSLGADAFAKHNEIYEKIKPIMVVMPAYNEAENLKDLLPRISKKIMDFEIGVLVVDDGSDDETFQVATQADICVIRNPINRGGGAALRLGYDILKKAGARVCVTMDADGQHNPEEIEKLLLPILNDQYDFVIGSRILGNREKDNLLRFIGVYIFGWFISLLLGEKITDPSNGFRAIKMNVMDSIRSYEDQYHTSELIIEAVRNRVRIGEAPVTIQKRKYGKSKKGADWKYAISFTRAIVKTWWR